MKRTAYSLALLGLFSICLSSCGGQATLFNPAFLNSLSGGVVPMTPGPTAAFVFVRGVNETTSPIDFFVRIERRVPKLDENGNIRTEGEGENEFIVTDLVVEHTVIPTGAGGDLSDAGVLFPCGESPVVRVGLGQSFLPTDIAARVGGTAGGGAAGFGVRVGNLSPLRLDEGNFNCGDTIIFRAFEATGIAGGIALQTFLLPGSEQPSMFGGPSTFANFEALLEATRSQEGP